MRNSKQGSLTSNETLLTKRSFFHCEESLTQGQKAESPQKKIRLEKFREFQRLQELTLTKCENLDQSDRLFFLKQVLLKATYTKSSEVNINTL
ncbi:MAG: hypothetical protein WC785_02705 [Tatlockia sp.]